MSSHQTSASHSGLLCFVSPFLCTATPPSHPDPISCNLFVEQGDLAVVTVVAAHLAVGWIQAGGVGEGRRQGVIVHGGVWVARRGEQGLGVWLG